MSQTPINIIKNQSREFSGIFSEMRTLAKSDVGFAQISL